MRNKVNSCPLTESCRLYGENKICSGYYALVNYDNVLSWKALGQKDGITYPIVCASQTKIIKLENDLEEMN